jgi:hypothetical protein
MNLDMQQLFNNIIVGAVLGVGGSLLTLGTWIVSSLFKLRRDMNACFIKIRALEKEQKR